MFFCVNLLDLRCNWLFVFVFPLSNRFSLSHFILLAVKSRNERLKQETFCCYWGKIIWLTNVNDGEEKTRLNSIFLAEIWQQKRKFPCLHYSLFGRILWNSRHFSMLLTLLCDFRVFAIVCGLSLATFLFHGVSVR